MSIFIPLSRITENPFQTRLAYGEEHIEELAADIQRNSLMQVPVARLASTGSHYTGSKETPVDKLTLDTQSEIDRLLKEHPYVDVQLAFGHNRWKAYQLLAERGAELHGYAESSGGPRMEIELRPLDDEAMANRAWAENAQRKDLNPYEEAQAIADRIEAFGWTQAEAAEQMGLARSTVSNKLRMLDLPEIVTDAVRAGGLSERQAVAMRPVAEMTEEQEAVLEDTWHTYSLGDLVGETIERERSSDYVREAANRTIQKCDREIERQKKQERRKEKRRQERENYEPRTLILLACSSEKAEDAANEGLPARELYQGEHFRKSLALAERLVEAGEADAVRVLSAEHHVVALGDELEPYDRTLSDLGHSERKKWNRKVRKQLARDGWDLSKDRFLFFAGEAYRSWADSIPDAVAPLEGLGIGEQLSQLKTWNDAELDSLDELDMEWSDEEAAFVQKSELRYDEFDSIRDDEEIDGCDGDCPCRTMAVDYHGRMVPICMDPDRRRAKKGKTTRRLKKEKREEVNDLREQVSETLGKPGMTSWSPAAVATIMRKTMRAVGRGGADAARDAADALDLPEALAGFAGKHEDRDRAERVVNALSADEALRFLLHVILEAEWEDYVGWDHAIDRTEAILDAEPYDPEKQMRKREHREAAGDGVATEDAPKFRDSHTIDAFSGEPG